MKHVLIIGASRGLGLEFVRQYREAGDRFVATAGSDEGLAAIAALGAKPLRLDVATVAGCAGLAWQIDGQFRYAPDLITEIEVTFTDQGDGATRVDLEHRNLERLGDDAEHGRAMLDAPNGWGLILTLYAQAASA